jgi:uncharacterized protein YigA (DUF484 family)
MSDRSAEGPGAHEVASYLRRHPEFLNRHPDLALTLVVPREHAGGRATSLASYQLDVLRDKNRELGRRIKDLVEIAGENELLMRRVHALNLALMQARTPDESVRRLVAALREDFGTDQVRLLLHAPDQQLPAADWLLAIPADDPGLDPIREILGRELPLAGRLTADQLDVLFGAEAAGAVASCALLPLPGLGLLVIGSPDGNRFHAGQGTFFLELIAATVTAALRRYGDG